MNTQNQLTTTDGPAGSLALDPRSAPRPTYFVMPNLPRDVWYGYVDKPESAQLVAFVEMRHAYINPEFDAEYTAAALNANYPLRKFAEEFSKWVECHPKETAPWAETMRELVESVRPFLPAHQLLPNSKQ